MCCEGENYLILKNLEERYVKDKNGWVLAAYEIQYLLIRDARSVPKSIINKFETLLLELGFVYKDYLL